MTNEYGPLFLTFLCVGWELSIVSLRWKISSGRHYKCKFLFVLRAHHKKKNYYFDLPTPGFPDTLLSPDTGVVTEMWCKLIHSLLPMSFNECRRFFYHASSPREQEKGRLEGFKKYFPVDLLLLQTYRVTPCLCRGVLRSSKKRTRETVGVYDGSQGARFP